LEVHVQHHYLSVGHGAGYYTEAVGCTESVVA